MYSSTQLTHHCLSLPGSSDAGQGSPSPSRSSSMTNIACPCRSPRKPRSLGALGWGQGIITVAGCTTASCKSAGAELMEELPSQPSTPHLIGFWTRYPRKGQHWWGPCHHSLSLFVNRERWCVYGVLFFFGADFFVSSQLKTQSGHGVKNRFTLKAQDTPAFVLESLPVTIRMASGRSQH